MFFAVFKKAAAFYLKGRLQFLKGRRLLGKRPPAKKIYRRPFC
jgi:hypothetical protein